MAATINTQVDTSILQTQMGIEVLDDGNGYLSAGDVLIRRTSSQVTTREVTAGDLKSPLAITALLNEFTGKRSAVSFVFDTQRAKSFIASASANTDHLRLYGVTASADEELISDGSGIKYPEPQRMDGSSGGSFGGRGSGLGGGGTAEGLGGLGRPVRYDLATTYCDSKTTDQEKLTCYKEEEAATARAEKLGQLQEQAGSAKEAIRTAVLDNSLTPEIIAEFTKIQAQIAAL
jgi:hypothetical protein